MKPEKALPAALASAPFLFVDSRRTVTAWRLGISVFEALVTFNSESKPRCRFLWFKR